MSKKQKLVRWIISGTLLAAVVLVGVSVYQVETSEPEILEEEEYAEAPDSGEEQAKLTVDEDGDEEADSTQPHHATVTDEDEELAQSEQKTEDAASGDVSAQVDTDDEEKTEDVDASVLPTLNFSEDSLMSWPVNGQVVLDYSMDHTVYFQTLDVYKYNPSIIVGTSIGEPVIAAANCKILSIEENTETGTTITADLGNGYQAVYGQLADVQVAVDDVVAEGTTLGYVNEQTRFYAEEGSNLYFAMTKDGESIDPIVYLP
ncbi:MAG: peptidoglycan DD-metalloendopeptidase family protein [Lachnospiraceae bacterium]|nr:peptidoglycan DD-metalloendopeptidase family protein [Lachnospiraceae bacterium]